MHYNGRGDFALNFTTTVLHATYVCKNTHLWVMHNLCGIALELHLETAAAVCRGLRPSAAACPTTQSRKPVTRTCTCVQREWQPGDWIAPQRNKIPARHTRTCIKMPTCRFVWWSNWSNSPADLRSGVFISSEFAYLLNGTRFLAIICYC